MRGNIGWNTVTLWSESGQLINMSVYGKECGYPIMKDK